VGGGELELFDVVGRNFDEFALFDLVPLGLVFCLDDIARLLIDVGALDRVENLEMESSRLRWSARPVSRRRRPNQLSESLSKLPAAPPWLLPRINGSSTENTQEPEMFQSTSIRLSSLARTSIKTQKWNRWVDNTASADSA
jgi:hypothetical protein